MTSKKNVQDTNEFAQNLYKVMDSIFDLMKSAREDQPAPEEVMLKVPDKNDFKSMRSIGSKIPYEVSKGYDRATEFLTSFLDIVRVNFEPGFFGTFLLNANMDFIYANIPDNPFQLGYASITHEDIENLNFEKFWNTTVQAHLVQCGYNLNKANAVFVAICSQGQYQNLKLIEKVAGTIQVGFTVEEVLGSMAAQIKGTKTEMTQNCYTGFAADESLGKRLRVSIWMFNENSA